MVSNYDLTILKNKLDKGYQEIQDRATFVDYVIDSFDNENRRKYRSFRKWFEYIEDKFCCIFIEIRGYFYFKFEVYENCINPIIIDLLV